jgi:hypothetical protein
MRRREVITLLGGAITSSAIATNVGGYEGGILQTPPMPSEPPRLNAFILH